MTAQQLTHPDDGGWDRSPTFPQFVSTHCLISRAKSAQALPSFPLFSSTEDGDVGPGILDRATPAAEGPTRHPRAPNGAPANRSVSSVFIP